MSKKILILGAGYAGIEAALSLQKKKKKNEDIEITIIDKNSYHTLLTELHEVAGNRINEEGVIVPLRDIFRYTDVKVVQDQICKIDFSSNTIISQSNKYSYDYLVIATGSQPNFYGIEGLQENSFTLWSYEDAIRIREQIQHMFIMATQTKDPAVRKSMLTFVVGGGGFTGVEMIGELGQWTKSLCKEYNIPREEVKLILVEALPKILSNLKDKNINKTMNYLQNKLKVQVLTNAAITKLTEEAITLKDGTVIPTRTLIWTAGVRASCLCDQIDIEKAKACRLKVDEYTRTQHENVYAVGDVSAFFTGEYTLPALVEAALQTGKAAAHNILADIRGKEKEKLEPKLHGVMVSVGSFFAASDLMGVELPSFLSILMKYLVNIHYLFGVGGFELVIRYLKHEVLEKKQDKFLVEKHYSVLSPTFWLVPIRLFLGYAWLMEGVNKIKDEWLEKSLLAGLQVDTETSASVFSIVSKHTPGWYAWIADNFVIPHAMLFQVLIVLTEIGIGLALISGTFTSIAAVVALALNINFILSTGMTQATYWYIPAALCLLGGAGSAFGVDYYLLPYLMRQWRYFVRNRKIKLFLFR